MEDRYDLLSDELQRTHDVLVRNAFDAQKDFVDTHFLQTAQARYEVVRCADHDRRSVIEKEFERLFAALDRPNVMVKVPATPEGMPAIRSLIGKGINVNVTLIFSRDAYRQVADAYIGGLEDLAKSGGDFRH